jgi:hypothetical protein
MEREDERHEGNFAFVTLAAPLGGLHGFRFPGRTLINELKSFWRNLMSTRTIARLFDDYEDAARAVSELEAAGIPHGDISLMANNAGGRIIPSTESDGNEAVPGAEAGAGLGAVAGGGVGVLAGLGLLAIPGVGPVVAAGWLAALAVGAVGGAAAGGLLGGLVGSGISAEHAEVYTEGVRRGGTLVTAHVPEAQLPEVDAILNKNAVDPVARRAEYSAEGWSSYDPNGSLVTEADLDRERRVGGL